MASATECTLQFFIDFLDMTAYSVDAQVAFRGNHFVAQPISEVAQDICFLFGQGIIGFLGFLGPCCFASTLRAMAGLIGAPPSCTSRIYLRIDVSELFFRM
jgi:hypothetical protein